MPATNPAHTAASLLAAPSCIVMPTPAHPLAHVTRDMRETTMVAVWRGVRALRTRAAGSSRYVAERWSVRYTRPRTLAKRRRDWGRQRIWGIGAFVVSATGDAIEAEILAAPRETSDSAEMKGTAREREWYSELARLKRLAGMGGLEEERDFQSIIRKESAVAGRARERSRRQCHSKSHGGGIGAGQVTSWADGHGGWLYPRQLIPKRGCGHGCRPEGAVVHVERGGLVCQGLLSLPTATPWCILHFSASKSLPRLAWLVPA
jgi:hypothetical protein